MALVYVAMCVPNGKLYFGITSSLRTRIRKHVSRARRDPQFKFHHALCKHGSANFVWYEIGYVATWPDACEIERALIRYFDTTHTGYNTTEGGEGSLGRRQLIRAKRRDAKKRGRLVGAYSSCAASTGEIQTQI